MKNIIAIIPARGGSKSIPKKNIVDLCGKPLIAYSIIVAKNTKTISHVIVDTDDEEIASVARKYGAEIYYKRPKYLADDITPDLPVFKNALNQLKNQEIIPDIILHLRPTSPYRTKEYLARAIKIFIEGKRTTCVRGVIIPDQTPYKMWKVNSNGYLQPLLKSKIKEIYNEPRQKIPKVYWQIGNIDVIDPKVIIKENSMTGKYIKPLFMEEIFSIDIDSPISLQTAEIILKPYLSKITYNNEK